MRMMSIAAAAVVLAGCSAVGPDRQRGAEILARELAGRIEGPAQACIPVQTGQGLRVIDARTLAYQSGRTFYVNRLRDACPALSSHNTVIAEVSAGEYCRGDRVRGLEPGAIIAGPSCNLQDWVPYRQP